MRDDDPVHGGKKNILVTAVLCAFCTLIGALYPSMIDWSKTAVETRAVISKSGVEWEQVRAYPFSPVSVVLVSETLQVGLGLLVVHQKASIRSMFSDTNLILTMMPLGAMFAMGEWLTLRSVQKGSGPVYVVISNTKLVMAALISRIVFGKRVAMPWANWVELVLICAAAAVYTLLEADSLGSQWRWEGACMALLKSALVAFSSVFCEQTYKNNSFYMTVTLQACWALATMTLLILISLCGLGIPTISAQLRDSDGDFSIFSSGSKHPLCDSAEHMDCKVWLRSLTHLSGDQEYCNCLNSRGWEPHTVLTVFVDICNAVSSALIFKKLSAVAKYVCRASSAVPMYVLYCLCGRAVWSIRTFGVVAFLCFQVGLYTVQRHAATSAGDSKWVQAYSGPKNPHTAFKKA